MSCSAKMFSGMFVKSTGRDSAECASTMKLTSSSRLKLKCTSSTERHIDIKLNTLQFVCGDN